VGAQLYSLVITVENGRAVISAQSGVIPDGTVFVNGKSDDQHVTIGVTSTRPDGTPVVQASGTGHPFT